MKFRSCVVFILGLLMSSMVVVAQNSDFATIECMYRYRYVFDTTAVIMSVDGMVADGDSTKIVTDHFLLYCGGAKSMFYSYDNMVADSVFEANRKAGHPSYAGYSGGLGCTLRIYKDFGNSTVDSWDKIAMEWFRMEEQMPDFNWQIGDEWKEIEGYRVQKATCRFRGRDYEAWFAPEVTVADGPWKFCGLPGLIFVVYDTPCQYHYRLTGIRKRENAIKYPDENYISIKSKKFYTALRRFIENPALYMSNTYSGSVRYVDTDGNSIDPETMTKKMEYDFQEREFK